jgi:hypothetical protein
MAGNLAGKLTKSAVGTKGDASATAPSDRRIHLDQAPLTGTDLFRFTADLARRLGVTTALDPRNIRVNSYPISQARADEPPEQPTFLNSYIVDDLALVSNALDHRDAGTALAQVPDCESERDAHGCSARSTRHTRPLLSRPRSAGEMGHEHRTPTCVQPAVRGEPDHRDAG